MELYDTAWLIHSAIAAGSIGLSQLAAFLFRRMALRSGYSILEPLTKISEIQLDGMNRFPKTESTNNEKLRSLFDIITQRKEHHKKVFLKLYQYYFASVSVLLILSIISAIVVFIVAENGLKNSDPYTKTVFFTFAALTTLYALSPIVYKQDITINKNLKNYIQYDNMQDEIYNYGLTDLTISAEAEEFNKFHSRMVKRISEINSIDLDFDFKSIRTPDFFKRQE